jgi:chemotaxis protein MotB
MKLNRLRSSNEGWLTSYADLITNLLIFFVLIISASQVQTGKMEKIIEQISNNVSTESLSSAAKKVEETLKTQELRENVSVDMTDSGLEIVFDSGVMFSSGSAEILTTMNDPLNKILEVVKPYTEKYRVAVEGHTDENPIRSSIYKSNWELSSARAMQIRERLETIGVDPKKIRVEAYADKKALKLETGANLDRAAFLAKHRRVVIRLF